MASYLIGVDIGTQGTKTVLFDMELNAVSFAFEGSRLISPQPGVVWQEPDEIYQSCVNTIRESVERAGIDGKQVAAIGIDGQMAGLLGVDRETDACTYYDSWLDTRCDKYIEFMRKKAGDRIMELCGAPVSYHHGPKILWWKKEKPEAYRKIYKFLTPYSYVACRMADVKGEDVCFDYTCLMFSGFGENQNKKWSDELLGTFEIDKDKMARIVSPFEIIGKTGKEFSNASGLPTGIPVTAGCGDTAASTFGAGLFDVGMLLDCAGTGTNLCSLADRYVPDMEYRTITMLRSPIDGYFVPLAYTNGSGMCLRWFRDNFSGTPACSYEDLEREAVEIPDGSEGLLFLPHFAGRVLPNNPYIKGTFAGLDWKHTRAHLYRAIMEGIAYEHEYFLRIIKKLYKDQNFNMMYSIGGGSKSQLFNSIKANMLGVRVRAFKQGDTAPLGSAVIAGVACGAISDYKGAIRKTVQVRTEVEPDAEIHARYVQRAEEYHRLIRMITPFYKFCPAINKK